MNEPPFPIFCVKLSRSSCRRFCLYEWLLKSDAAAALPNGVPALRVDGLINMTGFNGCLGAVARIERKRFALAEQLYFHRPRIHLFATTFVGESVLEQSLFPVLRLHF